MVAFTASSTDPLGARGAMELKIAWRLLGASDDASRYITEQVLLAVAPDLVSGNQPICATVTVGMVGMHIIQRNPDYATNTALKPEWIWSTFEHVDNAPLAQAACDPATPNGCVNLNQPSCGGAAAGATAASYFTPASSAPTNTAPTASTTGPAFVWNPTPTLCEGLCRADHRGRADRLCRPASGALLAGLQPHRPAQRPMAGRAGGLAAGQLPAGRHASGAPASMARATPIPATRFPACSPTRRWKPTSRTTPSRPLPAGSAPASAATARRRWWTTGPRPISASCRAWPRRRRRGWTSRNRRGTAPPAQGGRRRAFSMFDVARRPNRLLAV